MRLLMIPIILFLLLTEAKPAASTDVPPQGPEGFEMCVMIESELEQAVKAGALTDAEALAIVNRCVATFGFPNVMPQASE